MSTSMNTSKEHSTDTASTLLQASQPPLDTQEHKPKAQAADVKTQRRARQYLNEHSAAAAAGSAAST
ncbi:hypothetical protein EJ05DRAFT_506103 [Pseudovirgaria hyperparasitica]|uniref:Uncharacterized protein n=1 Tax=Pseudovirgaria hyperparasitica TaxID=470096 RepID=A0A6A6VQA0_9PEZI|nr:uncharacterized protein EJ05DRAFT_506103 [Pseudovirgaria hyperparasitica]KAF2752373.1 hypothetical protein EJ05DRAFT_506103 [Pseudovirgaria hyperparasitica]